MPTDPTTPQPATVDQFEAAWTSQLTDYHSPVFVRISDVYLPVTGIEPAEVGQGYEAVAITVAAAGYRLVPATPPEECERDSNEGYNVPGLDGNLGVVAYQNRRNGLTEPAVEIRVDWIDTDRTRTFVDVSATSSAARSYAVAVLAECDRADRMADAHNARQDQEDRTDG